jgi:hypothetical protein
MNSKLRLVPVTLLVAALAALSVATPTRADVIMDWNSKADAIAAEKQIGGPQQGAGSPCFTSRCSRR